MWSINVYEEYEGVHVYVFVCPYSAKGEKYREEYLHTSTNTLCEMSSVIDVTRYQEKRGNRLHVVVVVVVVFFG